MSTEATHVIISLGFKVLVIYTISTFLVHKRGKRCYI